MKNLTKIFFCIFTTAIFFSCEPEEMEIASESDANPEFYSDTGNQETPIDDEKP